jgi:hypothetical protein
LKNFDASRFFIPLSDFDDVFCDFIASRKEYRDRYAELLKFLNDFEYPRLIQALSEVHNSIYAELGIAKGESRGKIIELSSMRYLCDQVSLSASLLLRNGFLSPEFTSKCETIRNKRLNELEIPDVNRLFQENQQDKTVFQVFSESVELTEALNWLRMLQFYSSPVDIAFVTSNAISVLRVYAACNEYRNRSGDFSGEVPPDIISGAVVSVCFDDMFVFFSLAFAVDPPPNAAAIVEYLNAFKQFLTSGVSVYAATTLQAAVSYISDRFKV